MARTLERAEDAEKNSTLFNQSVPKRHVQSYTMRQGKQTTLKRRGTEETETDGDDGNWGS